MKLRFVLILFFIPVLTFSQIHEVGLCLGYGKTETGYDSFRFIFPFDSDHSDFKTIGMNYFFTISETPVCLKTGLIFDHRKQGESNLYYIKNPMGFDFKFGKEIRIIFGFGFYYGYLIGYNGFDEGSDFEQTKARFQVGIDGNLGFGFTISENADFIVMYQYNFDMTEMYEEQQYSPGGASYTNTIRGYDGFFRIGVRHKFIHK